MDTIDDNQPRPTAAVPLLDGVRLKLVTALKKKQSYYELTLLFPDIVSEAKKMPQWMYGFRNKNMTAVYLNVTGVREPIIWQILHTIPREVLGSVALGTVAYDMHRFTDRPKTYDAAMIGVYAIGISVRNRQGRWLTANELSKVIDLMHEYVVGYYAFKRHKGSPTNAREVKLQDIVCQVDNAFGTHDYSTGHVKFIESNDKVIHIRELIRSLKQRLDRSLALDPTGKTPMIQTPIYIGCSGTLEDRIPKHGIDTNLSQSNTSYAFTVSVMRMLGYEPSSSVMCVTRLWTLQQLPKAEVLVAAFASCYVTQDGFNRVECGDNQGSGVRKSEAVLAAQSHDAEEYITGRCPFMLDNLLESLGEIELRRKFLEGCDSLSLLFDPPGETIQDELDTLETDYDILALEVQKLDIELTNVKKRIKEREEEKQALEDEIQLIRLLGKFCRRLKELREQNAQ